MNAADVIAQSLSSSQMMLMRHINDLTPAEYLHRVTPRGNCTAWLLGHLILTERRPLTFLGVPDLPALPEGFEQRFARNEMAPFAAEFGDVTILGPLFEKHRGMLIEAVKHATPEQLDKPLEKVHPMFWNQGTMINFMGLHVVMHTGQISMIRRSLGKPPLV
jgi:hypothetical protein